MPPANPKSAAPGLAPRLDARLSTILAVAVATQAAGSIVSQGIYLLVPFWRDAFSVSLASASLAVTVMNGTQIATMFVLGRAIDRHGERVVVGLAMLGMGVAMACAATLAASLAALLFWIAILGGTYAAVQLGGTRAIVRWFPPHHRGLATGLRQAAVPFGTMLAAASLPALATRYGWTAAAWAAAGASVFGGALFWLFYSEGEPVASAPPQPLSLRELLPALSSNDRFWPVLRLGIAMSAFQFTLTTHVITFMAEALGVGLLAAASLFAVAQLAGIPGRVLLPWASDRLYPGQRTRILAIVSLVAGVTLMGLVMLPSGVSPLITTSLFVVLGLFGIGWYPLYVLQIAESAPKTSVASTLAFATTLCMVAMALGPFLFGLVVEAFGYTSAWALLVAPVVATALPALRPARPTVDRNDVGVTGQDVAGRALGADRRP